MQSADGGLEEDGASLERTQDEVGQQDPDTPTTTTSTRAAGGRRHSPQPPRVNHDDDGDDDDEVFGELVVSELRHIRDPATRLILRHNILTTIFETRLVCLQQQQQQQADAPRASVLPRRQGTAGRRCNKRCFTFFSRPYLSNGRAYGTGVVRRLSVCLSSSVTDVLWLSVRSQGKCFYTNN